MKRLISFALVLISVLVFSSCSAKSFDAEQLCSDGLNKLNMQNEFHYATYNLEGSSNGTYKMLTEETEYWVSGENWLSHTKLDDCFTLSVGSEQYYAVNVEAGTLLWEPKMDSTDAPVPIPELDLNIYHVESDKTQDGIRTITFSSDNTENSGKSVTCYKLVFQFKDDSINQLNFSKQITFPRANGEEMCIFYTTVTEYYEFDDGDISEKIISNYEVALRNRE